MITLVEYMASEGSYLIANGTIGGFGCRHGNGNSNTMPRTREVFVYSIMEDEERAHEGGLVLPGKNSPA